MQAEPIHDRRHAEFAHAVVNVVAAFIEVCRFKFAAAFPHRQVGRRQVGRAANKFRNQWR